MFRSSRLSEIDQGLLIDLQYQLICTHIATTDSSTDISSVFLTEKGEIKESLDRNGIVVLPNCFDLESIKIIDTKILDYISRLEKYSDLKSYKQMTNSTNAEVVKRSGSDQGMIDVFHVDRVFEGEEEKRYFDEVRSVISQFFENAELQSINAYLNDDIRKTRGLHVDTYKRPKYKAFIYLTDVNSLNDGPYIYCVGSHRNSEFRRINKTVFKGKTDAPFVDLTNVKAICGAAGSLIISDQRGMHMGFPQNNGERRLLAFSLVGNE